MYRKNVQNAHTECANRTHRTYRKNVQNAHTECAYRTHRIRTESIPYVPQNAYNPQYLQNTYRIHIGYTVYISITESTESTGYIELEITLF